MNIVQYGKMIDEMMWKIQDILEKYDIDPEDPDVNAELHNVFLELSGRFSGLMEEGKNEI